MALFDRAEAADWLERQLSFFDRRLLTLREAKCPLRRLDDLRMRPSFIKLDVPGCEYKALRGSENALIAHEPLLPIESPLEETVTYLADLGYRPFRLEHDRFVADSIGTPNAFFMRPHHTAQVQRFVRFPDENTAWTAPNKTAARSPSVIV